LPAGDEIRSLVSMTDDFVMSLVDVRARVKLPESAANRITVVLVDLARDEGPDSTRRLGVGQPAETPSGPPAARARE
jgi:hypothetical protein